MMVLLFLMDLVLNNLTLSRTRVQLQQERILPNGTETNKKRAPFCVFEKFEKVLIK